MAIGKLGNPIAIAKRVYHARETFIGSGLLDQPDNIAVGIFGGGGLIASANVLDLWRIEQLGLVRRTIVRVLVTWERLVPTDDPA